MERTVTIGGTEYRLRRQTLALERDLAPLQDELLDCMRQINDISIRREVIERRRADFVAEERIDDADLASSGDEWLRLSREQRDKALEQSEIELRLIAMRIVDPPSLEVLVNELDDEAREEINRVLSGPPTQQNGTSPTDSVSASAISGSE